VPISQSQIHQVVEVVGHLENIVAEYGADYVYQRRQLNGPDPFAPVCVYVWNGEPDCIAGKVLARMGVSIEKLASYEGSSVSVVAPVVSNLGDAATNVLRVAQVVQDKGGTWGEALAEAKTVARVWGADIA
jgi:hypothetical protein